MPEKKKQLTAEEFFGTPKPASADSNNKKILSSEEFFSSSPTPQQPTEGSTPSVLAPQTQAPSVAPAESLQPEEDLPGRFASGLGSFAQSFTGALAGLPEATSIVNNLVADKLGVPEDYDPIGVRNLGAQVGKSMRDFAREAFPTNQAYQEEFITSTLAGGAGSLAAFFAGGMVGKGLKISASLVSALLGSTSLGADEFNKAMEATGGDKEKGYQAFIANSAIGATEAIPVGKALQRFDEAIGGNLSSLLRKSFVGGLEEAIQEAAQNFATNATAQQIYDSTRSLWDGTGEGGLAGFILGMGMNALGLSAAKLDKNKGKFQQGTSPDLEGFRANVEQFTGGTQKEKEVAGKAAVGIIQGLSDYTGLPVEQLIPQVNNELQKGEAFYQEIHDDFPVFYSRIEKLLGDSKQTSWDYKQLKGYLKKNGVKEEEIDFILEGVESQYRDFDFATGKNKYSTEGVLQSLVGTITEDVILPNPQEETYTQADEYTTPGYKSNYKELFVTAPFVSGSLVQWEDGHHFYQGIPNPIVRIRFDERITDKGARILHIEEIQPPTKEQAAKMPQVFRDNWLDIGLKRMVRWAAENGYKEIAWTTGKTQLDRYALGPDAVSELVFYPDQDRVTIYRDMEVIGDIDLSSEGLSREEKVRLLDNHFGQGVGEYLLSNPVDDDGAVSLDGETLYELTNSSDRHIAKLYDTVIPRRLAKLFKIKEVRQENLDTAEKPIDFPAEIKTAQQLKNLVDAFKTKYPSYVFIFSSERLVIYNPNNTIYTQVSREQEEPYQDFGDRAIEELKDFEEASTREFSGTTIPIHFAELPKSLRFKALQEGFPIFQDKKGAIQFNSAGQGFIAILKGSDPSTIVHELGHFGRRYLKAEDAEVINKWVGAEDSYWSREQEEKFARGFELWMRDGTVTSPRLRNVFLEIKKILANIYRYVKGSAIDVELSPEVEAIFDKLTGGWGLSGEQLESWAQSQVDSDQWIQYFRGETDKPPFDIPNTNLGLEKKLTENGGPPVSHLTDTLSDIEYRKPYKINKLLQKFTFPEFALYRRLRLRLKQQGYKGQALQDQLQKTASLDLALKTSRAVSQGQLSLVHHTQEYERWYKALQHGLSTEELNLTRQVIDLAYQSYKQIPNSAPAYMIGQMKEQRDKAGRELQKIYAKHPKLEKVVKGIDSKGGLIELFEYAKERYIAGRLAEYRESLDPVDYSLLEAVLSSKKSFVQAVEEQLDIPGIAKAEWTRDRLKNPRDRRSPAELETYWNSNEKVRLRKQEAVTRRTVNKLKKSYGEIQDIKSWGLTDFQTNIELGNYRITDQKGNTVGFAPTVSEANKKAAELRTIAEAETGTKPPLYIVEPTISRINPTVERRNVLRGDINVFNTLPRYIYAMEKRTIMNPVIAKYKRLRRENPQEFTEDVTAVVQGQINEVMGNRYSWIEKVADEFATGRGWETGFYRRAVGKLRSLEAKVKLGYRPTAALVNGASGFGMTYVKTGAEFYTKGMKSLRQGKYIAPNGHVVDMEKTLLELEKNGELGVDFAVQDDGTVSQRVPWYHPLRMFQQPELRVRRHSFASNYIMLREQLGLNHEQASWQALQNMYFQQATYNTAAIPEILRSPTGKLVGQFKTYMINHMQFWSTLNKQELARMMAVQLALGGPRGFIYLLKSLPVIGAFGLLDELEKEIVSGQGIFSRLGRGVAGLFNADISAPASFQLPARPEDWLGPALSDMFKLYKDVLLPGAQALEALVTGEEVYKPSDISGRAVDWAASLSPQLYYLQQLGKSVFIWETPEDLMKDGIPEASARLLERIQMPNVWIRDSQGDKAYQVSGIWDRILLLSGASPLEKSELQALNKIWIRNTQILQDNRRRWLDRAVAKLVRGDSFTEDDISDAKLYGIDPQSLVERYRWAEIPPRERVVLKAKLIERQEAIDTFLLNLKR